MKFNVKGTTIEFDESKLSPEVLAKVLQKGAARIFFERETGKKDAKPEDFQKAVAAVQADPNAYYATYGTRGEGTSRPKLNMFERKAKSWFSAEFLPALKLNVEAAVKLWAKAGGSGLLLTAKEDATAEVKDAVVKNQNARDKLIAAKAKKLEDSGWQPEMI